MNFEAVKNLLNDTTKICITAHYRPDGDAIGSSMALYHLLKAKGCKNVKVVMPSDFAKNLKWIPEAENIVVFFKDGKKAKDAIMKADVLFALDYNEPKRVYDLEGVLRSSKAVKVLIDHHPNPHEFAHHIFSDISYSSTCEMLHFFIVKCGWEHFYNATIADCLYMGILTDTGGFRYATSTRLMQVAGYLLDKGANDTKIINHVFDSNSLDKLLFTAHCLANRMEVFTHLRTVIIHATKEDFSNFKYEPGFTDGIVNQALTIDDIVCAIFVSPAEDFTKLSLRSKGNFAVNEIAAAYFQGGGHFNAAGGRSEQGVEETVAFIQSILPQYEQKLLETER